MHVKPAKGLKVPDPATGTHLPAEGIKVRDDDFYWIKRLDEGDVERGEVPEPSPAPEMPEHEDEAAHHLVTGEEHVQ